MLHILIFLSIETYFTTLIASLSAGCGLFIMEKIQKNINFIEQLLLIIASYLFTSVLIAIPFYLSNYQVTFLNSIFSQYLA